MTIQNAMQMIQVHIDQPEIRTALYRCESWLDWVELLANHGIPFTNAEFEEAVNLLHVKCQTVEAADTLLHRVDLLRMIQHSLPPLPS